MQQNEYLAKDRLLRKISADIPGFEARPKKASTLMKVLGKILKPINPKFEETFTTTLFNTVYYPRTWTNNPSLAFTILAHEWYHLRQANTQGPFLHSIKYLFPQWLSLLSLLSLLSIWYTPLWAWTLFCLTFLAPLPAYFRAKEELHAYTVSIAVTWWKTQDTALTRRYTRNLKKYFTSSSYYYMWPFEKAVEGWLDKAHKDVTSGKYDYQPVFKEVKEVLDLTWNT